jgi:ABC-type bacteriocin/lantibiotic exporter with double-glycine peptidase domain
MDQQIFRHLEKLKAFNNQRKVWLLLSLFVMITIITVTVDINYIQPNLLWTIVSIGVFITAVWWYWTMRIIRQLIEHQQEESEILVDVVTTIREIKEDVKKLPK